MDRIKIPNGESDWKKPAGFSYVPKGMKYDKATRGYINIHQEFQRWKKTTDYQKWRRKQFLYQGGLCWYCQAFLKGRRVHVEHVIPRSKGGTNNKKNLVLACADCNKEKGSTLLSSKVRHTNKVKNRGHKGTYLKNLEYWEANIYPYTDDGFYDMIRNF